MWLLLTQLINRRGISRDRREEQENIILFPLIVGQWLNSFWTCLLWWGGKRELEWGQKSRDTALNIHAACKPCSQISQTPRNIWNCASSNQGDMVVKLVIPFKASTTTTSLDSTCKQYHMILVLFCLTDFLPVWQWIYLQSRKESQM